MVKISNWGLYPKIDAQETSPASVSEIQKYLNEHQDFIPRGNGRCYGDSSLAKEICSTLKLNKFISFDKKEGIIQCESGVMLSDILKVAVQKKFFLPVTPGTKFITIGGAIASNVHGKNHHKEGAFSQFVLAFELLKEDGEILHCSREDNPDLFRKTIGGMGLTGVILTATIQLKPIETSYIRQKAIKASSIDELMDLFDQYQDYTYSVAWIDCLKSGKNMGRAILMLGEHASKEEIKGLNIKDPLSLHSEKQFKIPFSFPSFTLNSLTISIFNFLYYSKQQKKEVNNIIHYNPYFYPLDILSNWNLIYGKKGFVQYQFAIPFENGREGMKKILNKISESRTGSFLAVLKTFGEADEVSSSLSFPMKGYTLALDFKVNAKVLNLLEELDQIVLQYGGKLYLAKDSRMSKELFKKTYSLNFSHPVNFNSLQSRRLGI
ncbi:FAD-binding oxidoreductase [Algoriphagus machipongonensis]|uniref:Oxidoreductase, FAD-binding n=1 Tax=Algoriphagus machipongonensis TaxID=388413 RepID=A3HRE2_9BACT|nr:FAD-binding oxidoreductase [Algoriphagus machipongonensis]EAZ82410.1 putative oxidoreductase, FAD-binding [Algoriphagus machipongonensis]